MRVASLSLLCLTAFPPTASAECAWVLWTHVMAISGYVPPAPEEWGISDAFVSKKECEHSIPSVATNRMTLPSGRTMEVVAQGVCLPDTVDPRGPKGK